MGELNPGWKRWRFEQMAISVKDRVDDPSEAGVEHYIGLEHLDSDSLKIRRWGSPDDVSATKLVFRSGDIIFGRRRAYQRKLGVAEFHGIASAHALVLRANPKVALPGFLPFFMQSDLFMELAQQISVGSLSPTINWRTLARQEFALPPLEEQRRLVVLFRRVEDCLQALDNARLKLRSQRLSLLEAFVESAEHSISLSGVLSDTAYGSSTRASTERGPSGIPILRIPNVLRDEVDLSDLKYVAMNDAEVDRYGVNAGDVLLVRTNGNPDYVGRAVAVGDLPEQCVYASYLIRLRFLTDTVLPQYVVAMLNSPSVRQRLRGSVRSSAGNYNLNTMGIRRQRIPSASLSTQRDLVAKLSQMSDAITAISSRKRQLMEFKSKLLTETLS